MSNVKKVNVGFEASTEITVVKKDSGVVPAVATSVFLEDSSENPIIATEVNIVDALKDWVKQSVEFGGGTLYIEEKKEMLAAVKSLEDSLKEISASIMKIGVTEPAVAVKPQVVETPVMEVGKTKKKLVRKLEGVQKAVLSNIEAKSGKSKIIGLFGVTANPPHIGHCEVIRYALKHCDEVWVSPVFMHPFGKKSIPYEHRLAMLELIIEDFFEDLSELRRIKIVEVDKEYVEKNEKIPFSYDLLDYLRNILPVNRYALVIGEDNHQPEVWQRFHKYKEIEAEFDLIIAKDLGVHSTQIREQFSDLTEDALAAFCLPQAAGYMKKHRFW